MKIDEGFLEFALINIFACNDVGPDSNGCLDPGSLREVWSDYHLRSQDLDRAIASMLAKGHLIELKTAAGIAYKPKLQNSPWDVHSARALFQSLWLEMRNTAKLSRAQGRSPSHGDSPRRRRSTDFTTAAA